MAIRSGIDIVDLPRFAEQLQSDAFIRKVFTPAEIAYCEAAENPTWYYAGNFAIKEAFMKAIGRGIRQEVWFKQIEVSQSDKGQINIRTTGKAKKRLQELSARIITVSISSSKNTLVATVLMEDSIQ